MFHSACAHHGGRDVLSNESGEPPVHRKFYQPGGDFLRADNGHSAVEAWLGLAWIVRGGRADDVHVRASVGPEGSRRWMLTSGWHAARMQSGLAWLGWEVPRNGLWEVG